MFLSPFISLHYFSRTPVLLRQRGFSSPNSHFSEHHHHTSLLLHIPSQILLNIIIMKNPPTRSSIIPSHDITDEADFDPIYHTGLNMGTRIVPTASDSRFKNETGVVIGVTPQKVRIWFLRSKITTLLGKDSYRVTGHSRPLPKELPLYPPDLPTENHVPRGMNDSPIYSSTLPKPEHVTSDTSSFKSTTKVSEDVDIRFLLGCLLDRIVKHESFSQDSSLARDLKSLSLSLNTHEGKTKKEG